MSLHRRIVPPVYFALTLALMVGLHQWLPLTRLDDSTWKLAAGVLLIVIGLGISATGAWAFKRAGTPVRPFETSTHLVIHGLYRYTRNPMYLGLVLALLGVWATLGSLSPGIGVILFALIIDRWFIRHEEVLLAQTFGQDYLDYKSCVRRWL